MRQDRYQSNDDASNGVTRRANIVFGCFVAIAIIASLGLFAHYFLS